MPRPSKKVYKYTFAGKVCDIFESVTDAVRRDDLEYNHLYNRISKVQPVNGFYYSYSATFIPPKTKKPREKKSKFFDIITWAKLMRY